MKVELNFAECEVAKLIAKLREAWHRERGNATALYWKDNILGNLTQAIAAELAVAKALNVYPPLPILADAPKFDMKYGGFTVDVKSKDPDSNKMDLLIPYLNEKLLYVLVWSNLPVFDIKGYIVGKYVKKQGEWLELPKKPCWCVIPERLSPIERLHDFQPRLML